uniref:Late embryogenesis abundant protein LEA-2 subgroup domain-containing protein n=1 Tax=Leersia perrieri TaxID=77586 RepID=A0A0D9W6Z2_9ORYZ
MGSPCDDGSSRGAARDIRVSAALVAASLIGLLLALFVSVVSSKSGDIPERPVYSVSITEFEDLPTYWNNKLAYSPVLGLTVHVKVPGGGKSDVCIGGHTVAAVVSYGGAFLAEGPVPRLSVKPLQEDAVAVAAWGWDAWVPKFLRSRFIEERERGEAAVDVAVPMRGGEVLVCKAKIGGDS